MDSSDKIARASLHIEVADRVRDMIFDRTLPPGHRVDELDLSAKLGTSRTPLREALKVLANEGLVRLAPGRGAYVIELSFQEVDALFPVLALVEGRCAAVAVRRQTLTDVRRLEAAHLRMEDRMSARDLSGYQRETDELHRLILGVAANPWFVRSATDLHRFVRLSRSMMPASESRLLQSIAEHRTLIKSIARGDAESAEQIIHHYWIAQQKAWRATKAVAPTSPASPVSAGGSNVTDAMTSEITVATSGRPDSGPKSSSSANLDAAVDTPVRADHRADRHVSARSDTRTNARIDPPSNLGTASRTGADAPPGGTEAKPASIPQAIGRADTHSPAKKTEAESLGV